ncbi:aldehyde dehydrogenase family protein [Metabacillus idriensis]|uniref:aldehyde dehydrogenase family protein n=1 Tax=Metabacillus idriensis TaxID=324768 RepID=UPI00203C8917|nr:aldehyde dehydrogenase family protein [Metabacillus idriensis]MCM3595988.1 aldehyde dehydrogenase family protein [Metabacillus idriensis]
MKQHLWINGQHMEASKYQELKSPYTDELLAEVAIAGQDQVKAAVDAASGAIRKMNALPAHKRADILLKTVQLLAERKEEAAAIIAKEAAKPIKTARAEVDRTVMTYTFAAEEARRLNGETISLDAAPGGENRTAYTVREPIGVIGAITPFNFPMNLVAHKLGPAFAAGNTVVLKPATQTPLSAYFIGKLFHEAGLPEGALNIVTGKGSEIGKHFTSDERIKALTFTGSPDVGKKLKQEAGMRKTLLELGSNSAVIVDDDTDVYKIAPRCVTGAFAYAGQVCISVQRIYVHESVFEEFVQKAVEATKKLKLGNPLDEETDVSSLISGDDVDRAVSWIEEAERAGAQIVCGGKNGDNQTVQPTILVNVPSDVNLSCQEAFAPIVIINSFKTFDEAIDEVNNSKYGLQAGVFTNKVDLAFQAAKALHVGGVMINDIPTFRVDHMPYGGVKDSGFGREGIKYAIEELTELKLISFNHAKF